MSCTVKYHFFITFISALESVNGENLTHIIKNNNFIPRKLFIVTTQILFFLDFLKFFSKCYTHPVLHNTFSDPLSSDRSA